MGVNGASLVCAVVLKGRKEEQRRRILPVQRLLPRGGKDRRPLGDLYDGRA